MTSGRKPLREGSKLFAVPLSAMELDTSNKRFILDQSKERLENAPGFDKDHWPDFADESWNASIHSYYGVPQICQDKY